MAKVAFFEIGVRPLGGDGTSMVVDVAGEIDVFSSERMKRELAKIIDSGADRIIINLGCVQYMDSTGLGVLVSTLKRLRERDGDVLLAGLNPHMTRIFEITGLAKAFTIVASEEDAPPANAR